MKQVMLISRHLQGVKAPLIFYDHVVTIKQNVKAFASGPKSMIYNHSPSFMLQVIQRTAIPFLIAKDKYRFNVL